MGLPGKALPKKSIDKLEKFFVARPPSPALRLLVAILISLLGYTLTAFIKDKTGFYFPSLVLVTVVLISLYSGFFLGVSAAIVISLAADYYFIPPVGTVLENRTSIEHFLITTTLSLLMAFLISVIRVAFRRMGLAKQEMERSQKDAEQSKAVMEKVLALVSHDIRNPITSIRLGAQMIQRTPGQTEKHQSILPRMLNSLERVDNMIQSLLDVTRLRAGKMLPLDYHYCDLGEEVKNIVEELSVLECNRLKLVTRDAIWGAWAIGGIRRVLENLVSNAMKYGDPDTPILVEVKQKGENAILCVRNQGPGIPVQEQKKLFDAFQRTLDSESGKAKGWGLGLALVKGIAEGHGGAVKVDSSNERGTTFTLELPIRAMEQVERSTA